MNRVCEILGIEKPAAQIVDDALAGAKEILTRMSQFEF